MRYFLTFCLVSLLSIVSLGCSPRPIVAEPNSGATVKVEVDEDDADVQRDANDEDANVNVQAGGGQGAKAEVDRNDQGSKAVDEDDAN